MRRLLFPASLLAAFASLAPDRALAQFSPKDSTATLSLTYTITGGGEDKPASHERHVTWKVMEQYTAKGTLVAGTPSEAGGLHKADAAQLAKRESDQAHAAAAMQDASGAMAQAEKIMAKCGEDEACLQREVMAMSRTMDMSKMESARAHAEQVIKRDPARYQVFNGKTFSGSYRVEESAREAYFDAACSLATEARCLIETTVNGQGPLSLEGKTTLPWMNVAEYDSKAGTLKLIFGIPAQAAVTRTTVSRSNMRKSGTERQVRSAPLGKDMEPVTAQCGACRNAQGSYTMDLPDRLLGRPAKLEVRWTFQRP